MNIIVFFVMSLHFNSLSFTPDQVLLSGGNMGLLIFKGQVWRLVSNTFIHYNLAHILGNISVLFICGDVASKRIGKNWFLIIYLFAGIVASICSAIYYINIVSAGASGAIFSILGIILIVRLKGDKTISFSALTQNIVLQFVISIISPNIDISAHIGGFITGIILTAIITTQK
jgi:rhomboid protease GluP